MSIYLHLSFGKVMYSCEWLHWLNNKRPDAITRWCTAPYIPWPVRPPNFHLVSKTLFSKKKATAYGSSLKRHEHRRAEIADQRLQTKNLGPTTAEELNHRRNHLRPPSIYFRRFFFNYCWFISLVFAGNLHKTESVLFGTGFFLVRNGIHILS